MVSPREFRPAPQRVEVLGRCVPLIVLCRFRWRSWCRERLEWFHRLKDPQWMAPPKYVGFSDWEKGSTKSSIAILYQTMMFGASIVQECPRHFESSLCAHKGGMDSEVNHSIRPSLYLGVPSFHPTCSNLGNTDTLTKLTQPSICIGGTFPLHIKNIGETNETGIFQHVSHGSFLPQLWIYIVDKQTGSKETAASDLWFHVSMGTWRRRHKGKRQAGCHSQRNHRSSANHWGLVTTCDCEICLGPDLFRNKLNLLKTPSSVFVFACHCPNSVSEVFPISYI
jgi:hypothetical protein